MLVGPVATAAWLEALEALIKRFSIDLARPELSSPGAHDALNWLTSYGNTEWDDVATDT